MILAMFGKQYPVSSEAHLADLLLRELPDKRMCTLQKSMFPTIHEERLYITKNAPFAVIQASSDKTEVCATTRLNHDPREMSVIDDDTEVPRAMCLSIEEMLELVSHYYRTGQLHPRGNWQSFAEIEKDRQESLRRQEPESRP